jgi:hypothetical protein
MEELTEHFPPNEYWFDIDVVEDTSQRYAMVWLTNYEAGINKSAKADPRELVKSGGLVAAVLAATERLVTGLRESGRLPEVRFSKMKNAMPTP